MVIYPEGVRKVLGKGESQEETKSRKLAALSSYEKVMEMLRNEQKNKP